MTRVTRGRWARVREVAGRYRDERPEAATRSDFDKFDRDDGFDVPYGRARNPLAGPAEDGAW
jgi:hypothetical protein